MSFTAISSASPISSKPISFLMLVTADKAVAFAVEVRRRIAVTASLTSVVPLSSYTLNSIASFAS